MLRLVTQPTVSAAARPQQWGQPAAAERLRAVWQRRHETDYIFNVATAFFWFVITLGAYGFYILYRLMRRSEEHNRRRAELFDAATAFAWEQARAQGLHEELRPHFEVIAKRTRVLHEQTLKFRDAALWVVFAVVTFGLAELFAGRAIDGDLVEHEEAERAIEAELAFIYSRLGRRIEPPEPSPSKGRHNVAGRVAATVATLGVYSLWWMRDLMVEGNEHLERNWWFEDDLARASQRLMAA
jgi:hypothetical protein